MKWLDRGLVEGPYLGLATKEAQFREAMKHCKVPAGQWGLWVSEGAGATTHTMRNPRGEMVCVVCIKAEGLTSIQTAALLVHEAVHVWQRWRDSIGEEAPSKEFEAYSIQAISQRLMTAYAERDS